MGIILHSKPIYRIISDTLHVVDVIVGFVLRDYDATKSETKFILLCSYEQYLNKQELKGNIIDVEDHFNVFRERGAKWWII